MAISVGDQIMAAYQLEQWEYLIYDHDGYRCGICPYEQSKTNMRYTHTQLAAMSHYSNDHPEIYGMVILVVKGG